MKNSLVSLIYKVVKLVIETNSKVKKPQTYNKAINDFFIKIDSMKLLIKSYTI